MPQNRPDGAYGGAVGHRTLRPASLAASGLPPIAYVRRPYVVRLSTTQPTTTTPANRYTSSGTPSTLSVARLLIDCTVTICVFLSDSFCASPRAPTIVASVTMNGTSRPYAMSSPFASPDRVPTSSAHSTITPAP